MIAALLQVGLTTLLACSAVAAIRAEQRRKGGEDDSGWSWFDGGDPGSDGGSCGDDGGSCGGDGGGGD